MELFLQNIGWIGDVFSHDRGVYEYFSDKREDDLINFENWNTNLEEKLLDKAFKELWDKFSNFEIEVPEINFKDDVATRVGGSKVLEEIGKVNKFILGGSADRAASTKQIISPEYYSSENTIGQSLEFGIREHAMAAITNGINLHSNLFAYFSPFLVFSDYMRPSIRLSSLMKLNSSYIFTHDSIYLGEDGPTHQPIEHLMSLRLIPDVDVIRPSNSIELVHSYKHMFSNTKSTKILSLSRQNSKFLNYDVTFDDFIKGAFEIESGEDLTIFATGTEVELALEIKEALSELSVQIISAPILNRVNEELINSLNITERLFTLELGRSVGWNTYLKDITKSFSIDTFGKSAPQGDLMETFKFTPKLIAEDIRNNFLN